MPRSLGHAQAIHSLAHFSFSAAGHVHGAEWVWGAMPLERWARAPASTLLIDAGAHPPISRVRCDLHFSGHGVPMSWLRSARQQARGSGVTACRRKEEQERKKRMISWPMPCFPFSYFFCFFWVDFGVLCLPVPLTSGPYGVTGMKMFPPAYAVPKVKHKA